MRPVLLEMRGFGSYREPATVDFADADFFALVGPTGAGKSTVVDAMTFVLYGSVPRWDDRRMVALALAPTENRGMVRLVFDVDGYRYIAVRELRRTQTAVGIRNARLEKLIDPHALGSTSDETQLIAADSQVNRAVEELLGLSFEHFCSCVVLPQGDFAEFLHAKPSDRHKILTRLLGIDLYETIGQRANAEAAQAKQRASLLEEQIGRLATVTPEAAGEADQRVGQLADLSDHVATVLPELAAAADAVSEARCNTSRIREEQALLAGLSVPTDLAARAERLAQAAAAANTAAQKFLTAEQADDDARGTFETAASARGPVEQAARNHAERAQLEQQLPNAKRDRAEAAETLATVTTERQAAMRGLAAAQGAFEAASGAAIAARRRVETVRAEHALLVRLSVPAGIAEIDEREAASRNALAAASRRLQEAEEAEASARRDLEAAPARAVLQQAKYDHVELAAILDNKSDLAAQLDRARDEVAARQTALDEGRRTVERARETREEAARTDLAAALRPHLVTGQPCPVCEHPVAELPAPLEHETLAAADAALKTAEDNLRTATSRHATAEAAERQAAGAVQAAAASAAKLRQRLTGDLADEAAVDTELRLLDSLSTRLDDAGRDLRKARADHAAAIRAVDTLTKKQAAARTALNAARDPLVSLGAPAVDGLDLAGAWNLLAGWADGEAAARTELLRHAEAEASEAEAASASTGTSRTRAREEVERLDAAKLAAARADQQTETVLHQITDRLSELAEALAGAPDNIDVLAELARFDRLETSAKAAREKLQAARDVRDRAADVLAALQTQERAAWDDLRTGRDPLVPLGAPPIQQDDLRSAWTELMEWAAREVRTREATSAVADAALVAAETHRDQTERALGEELGRSRVAVRDDRPIAETAPAAVAAELERARAHAQNIWYQLEQLANLTSSKETADDQFAVAHMLGNLLRSDQFPQWLVTSALDVLIQDASASLAQLSGGQFDLTHERGEFVVIDHNNADLRRPVKTLSGGETFQASLALALALSTQITTLAAAGAARLDSIFLDEGFGTLDETTLDTVADTLENLASQGERMVGVITHVSALADRVPVKFKVTRDQFGSTVTKDRP